MFDELEIRQAVDIQRRTYRLLRWTSEAIKKGFIHVAAVHQFATKEEAAREWITKHLLNAPPECRPAEAKGPAMDRFVAFFTSYVTTSFDIDFDPGERLHSHCGCFCSFCTYMAAAPHLKPKRITPRDKRRAEDLKADYFAQLIAETKSSLSMDGGQSLLSEPALSQAAAFGAYGVELLRRCRGLAEGPAVLALWRQFAWNEHGSPRRGFQLEADRILQAEQEILKRLRRH